MELGSYRLIPGRLRLGMQLSRLRIKLSSNRTKLRRHRRMLGSQRTRPGSGGLQLGSQSLQPLPTRINPLTTGLIPASKGMELLRDIIELRGQLVVDRMELPGPRIQSSSTSIQVRCPRRGWASVVLFTDLLVQMWVPIVQLKGSGSSLTQLTYLAGSNSILIFFLFKVVVQSSRLYWH